MSAILRLCADDWGEFQEAVDAAERHFERVWEESAFCQASRQEDAAPGTDGKAARRAGKGNAPGRAFARRPACPPIWFRGHESFTYQLLPGSLRNRESVESGASYHPFRLAEELRAQRLPARHFSLPGQKPDNDLDWLELMQHYGLRTRLLDWSEQAHIALLFAMGERVRGKTVGGAPVVWLLSPALLSERIYDCLREESVLRRALGDIMAPSRLEESANALRRRLEDKALYLYSRQASGFFSADNTVTLSRLIEHRREAGARLPGLIENGEFNPYFYLLLRAYADKLPLPAFVPPLATLQPSHSPRIEAQKGVFTIFPFPESGPATPMEENPNCTDSLCEIRLTNPEKIMDSLRRFGYGESTLYPEADRFAREME